MQCARVKRLLSVFLVVPLMVVPALASAERIQTRLSGYEEVPAVSTLASGEFRAMISPDETFIDYELTYSGLQAPVTQAHIHFAQPAVNGGIVVWLCGTAALPGPAGTPSCPESGTVSGTIFAAQVVGSATPSQQLTAGDWAEVIDAIRAGSAYSNVHTLVSPGGEIRGQIRGARHDD
jgi:hypothetical protein